MAGDEPLTSPGSEPIEAPQQTPLFHSLEQARYVRQASWSMTMLRGRRSRIVRDQSRSVLRPGGCG
jgi:hypothetical protein